jgi:ribosome-binding factor A
MATKSSGNARLVRMEAQVQRVLAELIAREVKDPRVGQVTVTQVQLARDLSVARVFYVPFGGAAFRPEIQAGLAAAAGFMRGEVGRRAALRHAPRLEFVPDDSYDRAARLSALIGVPGKPRD